MLFSHNSDFSDRSSGPNGDVPIGHGFAPKDAHTRYPDGYADFPHSSLSRLYPVSD